MSDLPSTKFSLPYANKIIGKNSLGGLRIVEMFVGENSAGAGGLAIHPVDCSIHICRTSNKIKEAGETQVCVHTHKHTGQRNKTKCI